MKLCCVKVTSSSTHMSSWVRAVMTLELFIMAKL
jgi:hypothetical protein